MEVNNGSYQFTLKYFINNEKSSKLIYEKHLDYTGIPFIYNLLDVDLVDLHKILSMCTRFFGRGVSLLSFVFYKLLIEACAKESGSRCPNDPLDLSLQMIVVKST